DLTQGFLASLLARSSLDSVAPERGRFRSFILASLRHYLADQRDRANAAKRGGGRPLVPLDAESAESHYARQVSTSETPETIFERQWAETLFQRAQENSAPSASPPANCGSTRTSVRNAPPTGP
ncbi:MAG: hypothetical protein HC814_03605, partial [Rhodobacteraceae bacterium]|nr:hypothetical protein [Paracoccaceae bacterium]